MVIMCRSSSKLGQVRSKSRSLGQILEKPSVHSRGSLGQILEKPSVHSTVLIQSSQNFIRMLISIISKSSLKLGHLGSKTRSLGQILE